MRQAALSPAAGAAVVLLACVVAPVRAGETGGTDEADEAIEEIEISASRPLRGSVARAVFGGREPDGDRVAAAVRLDRALAAFPDFSLFRRADSLAAHPTTQGPALRLKGPNASARALVLLDGVPIDNPFGGWVDWSMISPLLVARVETVTGSGAGPFGDRAETGVVMISTRSAPPAAASGPSFDLRLRGDGYGGRGAAGVLWLGAVDDGGAWRFDGFADASPGYHPISSDARGPVDRRLDTRATGGGVSWRRALNAAWTAGFDVRGFLERRINGLEAAVNRSRGIDATLRLSRSAADGRDRLDLAVWHRRRVFRNVFAIVLDDARSRTRAVLDQFRVPGRASGAVIDWWRILGDGRSALRLGLDIERRDGATNERFRNRGAGFTRLRTAGGRQWRAGVHGGIEGALGGGLVALADLRLDWWRNGPGRRIERVLADGSLLTDARFAVREGLVANGRAGLAWTVAEGWRLRADFHTGFRVPTLNELYRPFRVGKDVTIANAGLVPERLAGVAGGFDVRLGGAPSTSSTGTRDARTGADGGPSLLSFTFFADRLVDGVGNVTVAAGPGFFPDAGFVPAGGVLRERRNIPRIRNVGIEIGLDLALDGRSRLVLRHLLRDERIRRPPPGAEDLRGLRVAQSPRMRLHSELRRRLGARLHAGVTLEHLGAVFEDDRNRRRLPAATLVGAWLSIDLGADWKLRLSSDNLFDARVVDRLDPVGPVRRARPRFVGLTLLRRGA